MSGNKLTTVAVQLRTPFLCVDLDGTLVHTDTLVESVLIYLRQRPWRIFRVLAWLFLGKARFKQQLGREVQLAPDTLPYSRALLDYISQESTAGRKLLLVTAADASIAHAVAAHLGLFDQVVCSEGGENISGEAKLAAIRRVLGDGEFCYAGNSRTDLPVWKGAEAAIIVEHALPYDAPWSVPALPSKECSLGRASPFGAS